MYGRNAETYEFIPIEGVTLLNTPNNWNKGIIIAANGIIMDVNKKLNIKSVVFVR